MQPDQKSALPDWLPAAMVILCLVLGGGSKAAPIANLALQVLSLAIIVTLYFFELGTPPQGGNRQGRILAWIFGLWAIFIAASLIPMPPSLWQMLPGRDAAVRGFELLNAELPWLPLSLTPAETLWSGLSLLPVAATLLLLWRTSANGHRMMIASVLVIAAVNALLGIFQFVTGYNSGLYIYQVTNRGLAVGLFANANHLATFMAMTVPLAAYYFGTHRHTHGRPRSKTRLQKAALLGGLILLLGIASLLTQSNAGIILFAVALALSLPIYFNVKIRPSHAWAAMITAIVAVTLTFGIAVSQPGWFGTDHDVNGTSRHQIYPRAMTVAEEFGPVGVGLGGFARVYPSFEDPNQVTNVYANHAHSDVIELTVETGAFGLAFIGALLIWTLLQIGPVTEFANANARLAQAGMVVLAVGALHSLVDYPLRTAALAALSAAFLAILARRDWEKG